MKKQEIYAEMRCIPPVVVRADGRNFKNTLSDLGFRKPYDQTFARAMADAAELFIKKSGLGPLFAYTFSDEISFLFTELPFEGRVEKIDSIVASFLGSAFTINLQLEEPVAFDSRIIVLQKEEIPAYFHWRQLEAWRNFVAGWGYYTLRGDGMDKTEASKYLKGRKNGKSMKCFLRGGSILQHFLPGKGEELLFLKRSTKSLVLIPYLVKR
jgi:tRNA(His) guanylyltransferase